MIFKNDNKSFKVEVFTAKNLTLENCIIPFEDKIKKNSPKHKTLKKPETEISINLFNLSTYFYYQKGMTERVTEARRVTSYRTPEPPFLFGQTLIFG